MDSMSQHPAADSKNPFTFCPEADCALAWPQHSSLVNPHPTSQSNVACDSRYALLGKMVQESSGGGNGGSGGAGGERGTGTGDGGGGGSGPSAMM